MVEKPFASLPSMHPAVRRVIPIAWRNGASRSGKPRRGPRSPRRAARLKAEPTTVLDFQGLVKAHCGRLRAQGPRAGYDRASAREPLARAVLPAHG